MHAQHEVLAYSWPEHVQQVSNTHHLSMRNASPQVDPGPAARAQHSERLPLMRRLHLLTCCLIWASSAQVLLPAA